MSKFYWKNSYFSWRNCWNIEMLNIFGFHILCKKSLRISCTVLHRVLAQCSALTYSKLVSVLTGTWLWVWGCLLVSFHKRGSTQKSGTWSQHDSIGRTASVIHSTHICWPAWLNAVQKGHHFWLVLSHLFRRKVLSLKGLDSSFLSLSEVPKWSSILLSVA